MSWGGLNAAMLKCLRCGGDNGIIINADGRTLKRQCPQCRNQYPGRAKDLRDAKCPKCQVPLAGECSSVRAYDTLHGGVCIKCQTQEVIARGGVFVDCRECGQTFVVPSTATEFKKVLGLPIDFDAKRSRVLRADNCAAHEKVGLKPRKGKHERKEQA